MSEPRIKLIKRQDKKIEYSEQIELELLIFEQKRNKIKFQNKHRIIYSKFKTNQPNQLLEEEYDKIEPYQIFPQIIEFQLSEEKQLLVNVYPHVEIDSLRLIFKNTSNSIYLLECNFFKNNQISNENCIKIQEGMKNYYEKNNSRIEVFTNEINFCYQDRCRKMSLQKEVIEDIQMNDNSVFIQLRTNKNKRFFIYDLIKNQFYQWNKIFSLNSQKLFVYEQKQQDSIYIAFEPLLQGGFNSYRLAIQDQIIIDSQALKSNSKIKFYTSKQVVLEIQGKYIDSSQISYDSQLNQLAVPIGPFYKTKLPFIQDDLCLSLEEHQSLDYFQISKFQLQNYQPKSLILSYKENVYYIFENKISQNICYFDEISNQSDCQKKQENTLKQTLSQSDQRIQSNHLIIFQKVTINEVTYWLLNLINLEVKQLYIESSIKLEYCDLSELTLICVDFDENRVLYFEIKDDQINEVDLEYQMNLIQNNLLLEIQNDLINHLKIVKIEVD